MKKYIFFFVLVISWGCSKILCPAPDLRTSRQDYLNNAIKLDGIFYAQNSNHQIFLYKNGIYRSGCRNSDILSIPEKFKCNTDLVYLDSNKKDRTNWGIYLIKQDSIYMEDWRIIGDCTYDVFSHTGKILNDSTLVIPIKYDGRTLDTFRFAKFSPKPDSTNSFIK